MTDTHHAYRYAIYFAPHPGSPWWLAGSHWLGRCAALLQPLEQPSIAGVAPELLHRLTASPRRYGWHATLKAPFALAPGVDWITLHGAVQALAAGLSPFAMPTLQVQRMDDFLALRPIASHPQSPRLDEVAAACVTALHPLAQDLPASELARRRAAGLSPTQEAHLQRWGYPFVLDEYRFHLSLTGSLHGLPPQTLERIEETADDLFGGLPPLRFDSLALFAEPTPGADFVLLDHLEMGHG